MIPPEHVPPIPASLLEPLPPVPAGCTRIALIGDVVGKPGMRMVCNAIPWLRRLLHIRTVVVNAENAADGSGLRCKDYRRLVEHGVDAITLGDHAFRKREIMEVLDSQPNIVRAANWPADGPGCSLAIVPIGDGLSMAVTTAVGRVFMKPVDCPFRAVDRILAEVAPEVSIRLMDFHAEATSDMQLMGRHLDGRVTAVLGTHTHVATADEQILPMGTGFQCDVGMTGPFQSILGRKIEAVHTATIKGVPLPFQVATEDVRLNGTWFDAHMETGKCMQIGRIHWRESLIDQFVAQAQRDRQVL
ncbi:TIGR00282 family metallophosphoesterase [Aureliella helgolandensis]|uniref:Metallophosphoesterase n=1 Tax=Aureliella helgolandensis TaxID=2527968 RepID=A0A518G6A2_9BACT|nr:TIGR00282 family metallophosphoesterase [Aureliella helgolandensis]QDV24120.1 hypothetical protein Q31a_24330 [Aureliella helgolandensis]